MNQETPDQKNRFEILQKLKEPPKPRTLQPMVKKQDLPSPESVTKSGILAMDLAISPQQKTKFSHELGTCLPGAIKCRPRVYH